jgi:serine/threonine protein phosphatase 1
VRACNLTLTPSAQSLTNQKRGAQTMLDLQRLLPFAGTRANAAPPLPDVALYVIGDIHGEIGLLEQLLDQIDADIAGASVASPHLVFVGDYVDRGENSATVLTRLFDLQAELSEHAVTLMGNHERMMLDFLDDPITQGTRWLRYGGLQTLASFGIGGITETARANGLCNAADALRNALNAARPDMLTWLRDLPLWWQNGTVAVTHAGANPVRAMADQSERALLWGHPDFERVPRRDGLWICFGHRIHDSVDFTGGRVAVDTGGQQYGRLSCAVLLPDGTTRVLEATTSRSHRHKPNFVNSSLISPLLPALLC